MGLVGAGSLPVLWSEVWGTEPLASVALAVSLYRGGSQARRVVALPIPAPLEFYVFCEGRSKCMCLLLLSFPFALLIKGS